MAFDRKKYPPYWPQFSLWVRAERAGNKCEKCGVRNGWYKGVLDMNLTRDELVVNGDKAPPFIVMAFRNAGIVYSDHEEFFGQAWLMKRVSKIVRTGAHLDHRGGVCRCKQIYGFKCARPDHVLALCQGCHLALDREKHMAVQAKNRAAKKDAQRGLLNL